MSLLVKKNSPPYIWGDQNQDPLLSNLSTGTYILKATATDNDGATKESLITVKAGSSEEPMTLTYTPSSDAYLDNGNLFNASILRIENNRRSTYLQFDVSGISGSVTEAKLKLKVSDDPGNGKINVFRATGNNWNETNLNSQNAPSKGELIASRNGSWSNQVEYVFDVTSLLSENGTVSLILEMDPGGNDTAFSSKEGVSSPELSVTFIPGEPTIPSEQVLTPTSDAYLDFGNRQDSNILRVENNRRLSYLKYDLTQISGEISDLKLRLRVSDDPGNGTIKIYRGTTNNWNENNLSPGNAPAKGDQIGSRNGQWNVGNDYLLELNQLSNFGQTLSLIIEMDSGGNDTAFSSKEGANPPELIINQVAR